MNKIINIVFFLLLAQAVTACIIDQTHANTNNGVNWPTAAPTWGQSFMACQTGDVWEIAIWPNWSTNGIHTLVLNAADCTNLWTVPNINIVGGGGGGGNKIIVDLSTGSGTSRTVTSGVTYNFQLMGPSGSNLQINLSNLNPYANGGDIAANCLSYGLDWWFRVGINEPLSPLPVELSAFDAMLNEDDKTIELNFKTASEYSASHFAVEHSLDGILFEDIGTIKAIGTSSLTQSYKFIHQHPGSGNNYYRLKQVDDDRSFEYSKVVHVLVDFKKLGFSISPNPTDGDINIITDKPFSKNMNIDLFNAEGKLIRSEVLREGTVKNSIDSNILLPGIYFLKVSENGRTLWVERVARQ